MDLREANYMVSIYKKKNITKAARELFISQPSLSRYLQNVENQLGFPLFERRGSELIPTYGGKRYLDYATRILRLGGEWEDEYHELRNEKTGSLTIAIPLMRSSCMIPNTFPKFQKEYPNVVLSLREETHTISDEFLLNADIDFAVYNPVSRSSALEYVPLQQEPFVLVGKKGHFLEKTAVKSPNYPYPLISLKSCEQEAFVLHVPGQHSGRMALELFTEYGINPSVLLQTYSTEVAISLAASGIGLAFAPETYVKKMQKSMELSCFCLDSKNAVVQLMAVYRKGKYLPAYAKYYIELLKHL